MEFPLIISFLVFSSIIYVVLKLLNPNTHSSSHPLNRIPGPKKLPVIGNLHLLAGRSPPHHVFRDLAAKHGPLMRVQLGEIPFIIVSSAENAKQVLRANDLVFSNRIQMRAASAITYNGKDIALASYGESWRQLKKICALELLGLRSIRSFRRIREEENLNLARWIASNAGSPANLSERLRLKSFDIVARASVGKAAIDGRSRFTWAIREALKLGSGFSLVDIFPSNRLLPLLTGINFKISRIFRVTDEVLQSIIDEHKAAASDDDEIERTEDLVDVLLKYQQNEAHQFHFTTETIKAVTLDMLFGGSDTAASTVGWAMSEMIRNPWTLKEAQEEVRRVLDGKGRVDEEKFDEMKFLRLVIKETLRLHPPLPLLVPRMNSQGCEIDGYELPVNTRVMINAWALGRDPEYWNEAEEFKPERFGEDSAGIFNGNDFTYLPFGSGRRLCPGLSFGMVNVEFFLATLLYHFDWEMPFGLKNQDLDMREELGATVMRKTDLLLIPTLNRPLP